MFKFYNTFVYAYARRYSSVSKHHQNYVFFGLGRMGLPMATNLRASLPPASKLFIYDREPKACQSLKAHSNVEVMTGPDQVPQIVECAISMLPNSEHVEGL